MDRETRKFVTMIAVITACVAVFFLTPLRSYVSRERVGQWSEWVGTFGILAPLLFIGILAVTAVLGVPRMYPTLLIGALFPLVPAASISLVGSTIGAAGAFLFARRMGRGFVDKRIGRRFGRVFEILREHGFPIVTLLRVVPFSNFAVTNYLCGVSSIRFPDYVVATVLGMVPSTLMFVLLGRGLGRHDVRLIAASTVVFVVFTSLAFVYYRRRLAPSLNGGKAGGDSGAGPLDR